MFAQLMTWGEKILLAMAQFYSFLEQNLLEIFEGLGWQWLSDALDWLIDALGHLPEFLTLFGDELLGFIGCGVRPCPSDEQSGHCCCRGCPPAPRRLAALWDGAGRHGRNIVAVVAQATYGFGDLLFKGSHIGKVFFLVRITSGGNANAP